MKLSIDNDIYILFSYVPLLKETEMFLLFLDEKGIRGHLLYFMHD